MQGCPFRCKLCQNEHLQKYKEVEKITYQEYKDLIVNKLEKIRTDKIVFVGGEPLFKDNNNLLFLEKFLNEYGSIYNICIYTGYSVEDISLEGFSFLKTGQYIHEKNQEVYKTSQAMQFASSNQKLYDKNYNLLTVNGKLKFKENK